ncbi:hypothetical protein GGX14DRAFT_658105 [Mycena pura]|uniref:Uncharacterized protein n=1 Tax=Mycena pura TaxID=153505 RepID=A0AAD6YMF9_9AGAR|nr:hypothetical protein GGX14DRAFT_658105 [Mycena pura]
MFTSSQIDLLEPDQVSKMIDSMSLVDYHDICTSGGRGYRYIPSRWDVSSPVKLGSVRAFLTTTYEKSIELAFTTAPPKSDSTPSWYCNNSLIMENGWTRVHSDMDLTHTNHSIYAVYSLATEWLSQANYIFSCLNVTLNRQRAVLVDFIWYDVILRHQDNISQGFLFLCPATDLRMDDGTMLQQLDSVAYWSLDPTGIERLSAEDAKDLGFPTIELKITAWGRSFNGRVYDGLREFHQAKGFNPDSQDVARHLGYPLYEVSSIIDPQFAFNGEYHSNDEDSITVSSGKIPNTHDIFSF